MDLKIKTFASGNIKPVTLEVTKYTEEAVTSYSVRRRMPLDNMPIACCLLCGS